MELAWKYLRESDDDVRRVGRQLVDVDVRRDGEGQVAAVGAALAAARHEAQLRFGRQIVAEQPHLHLQTTVKGRVALAFPFSFDPSAASILYDAVNWTDLIGGVHTLRRVHLVRR